MTSAGHPSVEALRAPLSEETRGHLASCPDCAEQATVLQLAGDSAGLPQTARSQILALGRQELGRAAPVRRWEKEFLALCLTCAAVTILALLLFRIPPPIQLDPWWQGLLVIAVVALTQVVASWAVLSPGPLPIRVLTLVLAMVAMELIIAIRPVDVGEPWTRGGLFCTSLQFGLAVIPAGLGIYFLRNVMPNPWRGLVLGLCAGAVGVTALEVLCTHSRMHVMVFHVLTWWALAGAGALYEWLRRPKGFSP
jgi:hypothetical protein